MLLPKGWKLNKVSLLVSFTKILQSCFRVSSEYVQSLLVVKIIVIALSSASSVSVFGILFNDLPE